MPNKFNDNATIHKRHGTYGATHYDYAVIGKYLKAMRKLISSPTKWCKGEMLRIHPKHGRQYCLFGAFEYAGKSLFKDPAWGVLSGAVKRCESLIEFNDAKTRKHADILALLDHCIAFCEWRVKLEARR